jgi:DNA-binding NtrC family response regulator
MPDDDDMTLLLAYTWPGNVRELASVLERAAILGDGKKLEVRQALGIVSMGHLPPEEKVPQLESLSGGEKSTATLDEMVRCHIEEALSRTKGRVEGPFGAAGMLDINPQTLRAKMKKLGVDWKSFRPGRG